jgi:hypothetical protein
MTVWPDVWGKPFHPEVAAHSEVGVWEAPPARQPPTRSATRPPVQRGVTRQYVSWIKHTYGGRLTPREIVLRNFPFDVPAELGQATQFRRLRDHGEYVATHGIGMSEDKLQRLRSWYRKLREENLVVEFDPNISPIPGVSNKEGWAYRKRTPTDEDLLIRVNEYTNLSEEGRGIWRLPPHGP